MKMKTNARSVAAFALSWSCIIGSTFAVTLSPSDVAKLCSGSDLQPGLEDLCKPNILPPTPSLCPDLKCRPGIEVPVTVVQYNYTSTDTSTSWIYTTHVVPVTNVKTIVEVITSYDVPEVICKPTVTSISDVNQIVWHTSTAIKYNLTTTVSEYTTKITVSPPGNAECVTDKTMTNTRTSAGVNSASTGTRSARAEDPNPTGQDEDFEDQFPLVEDGNPEDD